MWKMESMRENLTSSIEDYLEAILELCEDQVAVRVTDLAAKLGVSKASVSEAIQVLKHNGLADQERYGRISLTSEGLTQAKKVLRRHQVLRAFLESVLGVNPEIAEKEACLMEHAVGPETMQRLIAFLERTLEQSDLDRLPIDRQRLP
jgi:DtxR family Mn-dependent transcriptional regulator